MGWGEGEAKGLRDELLVRVCGLRERKVLCFLSPSSSLTGQTAEDHSLWGQKGHCKQLGDFYFHPLPPHLLSYCSLGQR